MSVDILIFGGQSNMQGQTEGCPEENFPVVGALEYKHSSGEFVPLRHPVGEDYGDLINSSVDGGGSLVPDFCAEYSKLSGHDVIAIHAARGATTVAEWQKGTPRYECAIQKIKAGIEKAKSSQEIGRIYYIWLQGESDALSHTSEAAYIELLTSFKDALKNDVGIHRFCIIEVGYFYSVVSWAKDPIYGTKHYFDETIMRAQEKLPSLSNDFVLLTQICKELSLSEEYLNPFEEGHYNNKAMKRIGQEAARALSSL